MCSSGRHRSCSGRCCSAVVLWSCGARGTAAQPSAKATTARLSLPGHAQPCGGRLWLSWVGSGVVATLKLCGDCCAVQLQTTRPSIPTQPRAQLIGGVDTVGSLHSSAQLSSSTLSAAAALLSKSGGCCVGYSEQAELSQQRRGSLHGPSTQTMGTVARGRLVELPQGPSQLSPLLPLLPLLLPPLLLIVLHSSSSLPSSSSAVLEWSRYSLCSGMCGSHIAECTH